MFTFARWCLFYLFKHVEEEQQRKKAKKCAGFEGGCGGNAGVCADVSAVFLAFKRVLHCSQLSGFGLERNSSAKRQRKGGGFEDGCWAVHLKQLLHTRLKLQAC